MEICEVYYLLKLKNELSKRQRGNSNYSLRAFAKDLRIDSSNLSAILRNKRGLPVNRAKEMARLLNLSPQESALFINSTHRKKTNLDSIQVVQVNKTYLLDEIYYQVISEWEYYAFLQLLQTKNFIANTDWISKRLDIRKNRLEEIIDNLIKLKLIKKDDKEGYIRNSDSFETSEDVESSALHKSHMETLGLAKQKLEKINVKQRDYSSVTMAINPAKMPQAKALIREFQEKLYSLMSDSPSEEVYIFNSQFFPVTKII